MRSPCRRFAQATLGSCGLVVAHFAFACLPPDAAPGHSPGEQWDPPADPHDQGGNDSTSDFSGEGKDLTPSSTLSDSTATSSDSVDPVICKESETTLKDGQTTAPNLGFAANAVLDPWRFPLATPFFWAPPSTQPVRAIAVPNNATTNLSVQIVGDALLVREIVAVGENHQPGPATCRPRLEINAQARLRSEDGALDEVVPVRAIAHATGLTHVLFNRPWSELKGSLHVQETIVPQGVTMPTLGPVDGHLILSAGRIFGQIGAAIQTMQGMPAQAQTHPLPLGDASLDDPFCPGQNRVALPLEASVGDVSGSDIIDRLRNLTLLRIDLPDQTTRMGRLAVPNLPSGVCMAIGDGQQQAGGDVYLAADMQVVAEDGLTQLLTLKQVQVAAQPIPQAHAFSLFLAYDAFSQDGEDGPTFLTRHGLRDIAVATHSAYSLIARAFVDHTGKVGGFLQINGIERDPECTPQSPGCMPEIATELWRAGLNSN